MWWGSGGERTPIRAKIGQVVITITGNCSTDDTWGRNTLLQAGRKFIINIRKRFIINSKKRFRSRKKYEARRQKKSGRQTEFKFIIIIMY